MTREHRLSTLGYTFVAHMGNLYRVERDKHDNGEYTAVCASSRHIGHGATITEAVLNAASCYARLLIWDTALPVPF